MASMPGSDKYKKNYKAMNNYGFLLYRINHGMLFVGICVKRKYEAIKISYNLQNLTIKYKNKTLEFIEKK